VACVLPCLSLSSSHHLMPSRVIFSYLIIPYLILSYLISYLILSYLIACLSYLTLSYLILSYLILSYLISYLICIFILIFILPYRYYLILSLSLAAALFLGRFEFFPGLRLSLAGSNSFLAGAIFSYLVSLLSSDPVLSYLILYSHIFAYLILRHPKLSYIIWYLIPSYPLSISLSHLILSYFYLTLSCLTSLIISSPLLSYPILSYLTLSYLILSGSILICVFIFVSYLMPPYILLLSDIILMFWPDCLGRRLIAVRIAGAKMLLSPCMSHPVRGHRSREQTLGGEICGLSHLVVYIASNGHISEGDRVRTPKSYRHIVMLMPLHMAIVASAFL